MSASGRRATVVRMWRILVLLRQRPHRLGELAQMLGASERTIRRDLAALQAVPLPVESRLPLQGTIPGPSCRRGLRGVERNEWFVRDVTPWPAGAPVPTRDLPAALPPFPRGPLFPPGVRP